MRRDRQVESAARDYEEASTVARRQGARMLELRALTDWLRLPGAPEHVRADLERCVTAVSEGGPSRSLDDARRAMEGT